MKVGVTGGGGFIGTYVVEQLKLRGHAPLVFDHLGRAPAETEVMLGDVRDETAMLELGGHCDAIIHLAAILGTQETIHYPWPATETNVHGGLNFLHALKTYDIPGVYICVGNHWMRNPYSLSKTLVENFCHMFRDEHGIPVNLVRVVNAYGPRQLAAAPFGPGKVRKIIPAFVCRALSRMPVEVYGDGEQVSDMCYVGDVARVLVKAVEMAASGYRHTNPRAGAVRGEVIEVGPRISCTVNEVAELVIKHAARHTNKESPLVHLPMRPGELPGARVTANVDTLTGIADPDQFISLDDGIHATVDWFYADRGNSWHLPKSA